MAFDSNFELKFSQLVDTRLQEKIPSLYPNRVGFQLIDVNDAQDRGVGVMAFIVDGQWLYAPAFFLKGQLKGLELLYVKTKDLFVPLKDSWVSFIMKGDMKLLGFGVDKDKVKTSKPNLVDLAMSPHEKISNEQDSLIDKATLNDMFTRFEKISTDLTTELPKLGKQAFETFVTAMDDDADFANAVFNFYSPNDLRKMAEVIDLNPRSVDKAKAKATNPSQPNQEAASAGADITDIVSQAVADSKKTVDTKVEEEPMLVTPTEDIPPLARLLKEKTAALTEIPEDAKPDITKQKDTVEELKVVRSPDSEEGKKLTEKEKEILKRDGLFIKDTRKNTTAVFNTEVNTTNYNNPTSSGIYEILLSDGSAIPMLIIFPNKSLRMRSYSDNSSSQSYKHVRHTGGEASICLIDPEDTSSYYTVKSNEVLCKPAGRLPEEIYNKLKNLTTFTRKDYLTGEGSCRLVVDKKHNAIILDASWGDTKVVSSRKVLPVYGGSSCDGAIKFTGKDGKIAVMKNMVYIPKDAVYFKSKRELPWQLGDVNTFIYHMRKSAKLKALKIYSDRNGYALTTDKGQKYNLNKKAALIDLVKEQGIQAPLAKRMLKEAQWKGTPVSKRYFLKYADMYELNAGDPGDSSGAVDDSPRELTYDNPAVQGLQVATKASNKGIKEVMDTSILASLAGTSHSMELMGTYISDLIRAMDRVGRMLFLFYWHQDEFKDQYGTQELVELEESLRDIFGSMGDLILFLKEKSVDFDSLFSGNRGEISEDLGTVD